LRALVLLLLLAIPGAARAEEPAWRGWLGVGGANTLPDVTPMGWAGGGLSLGRWGGRLEVLGDQDQQGGLGQLTYELGRTRHHLSMKAQIGGGVRRSEDEAGAAEWAPLFAAGLGTQLGLMRKGPIFLGLDAGVLMDLGDLPLDVQFLGTLSLGLAF
jgi:hypothetical protein